MPIDSGKSFVLDFSNVKDQSGYNPTHMPAGDYEGTIKDAEYSDSKAGNAMVTYAVALADRPSAVYRYNCVLTEASLWKLRNLIVAAGKTIPKKKVKLSAAVLNSIIGKSIGITLEDDEYEGKMRSQIVGCFPASDLPDDSDVPDDDTDDDVEDPEEDEEPAPAKKSTKKAAAKPAKKKVVEEEEEELDELDIDDL
jgi:hypothetical protein